MFGFARTGILTRVLPNSNLINKTPLPTTLTSRRGYSPLAVYPPSNPTSIASASDIIPRQQTTFRYHSNISPSKQSKPNRFKRFLNKAKTYGKQIASLPRKYPATTLSLGIITISALGVFNPGIALISVLVVTCLRFIANDKGASTTSPYQKALQRLLPPKTARYTPLSKP